MIPIACYLLPTTSYLLPIAYYYSFSYFSMTVSHDYCYYYSYSLSFRGALWSFQAHQAFGSATVVEVKERSCGETHYTAP